MENRKVFGAKATYKGCFYARIQTPFKALGWQVATWDDQEDAKLFLGSDVITFHRPFEKSRYQALLLAKKLGKKVVFDNDDTFKVNDQMKLRNKLGEINYYIDQSIKEADLVTTTTNFLADEYRALNKNVVVLPNSINPNHWTTPLKNKTDIVRVGIFGSAAMIWDDFSVIQDLLKKLSVDPRVQLVCFGFMPEHKLGEKLQRIDKKELGFWEGLDVEWHRLVDVEDYPVKLNSLRLDIVLIPRADNYFNRCKSNIKFLESSMCEVPVIAQGFRDGTSPYQHDPHIKVATSYQDWQEAVEEMITDTTLRQEQGKKAREYVLNTYTIQNNKRLWDEAYSKI